MQDNDKAFLEFIVGSLVDHKDDIKIDMKNNARVNLKINEPAGGEPFSGASASVDDAIAGLKNDMEVI